MFTLNTIIELISVNETIYFNSENYNYIYNRYIDVFICDIKIWMY